MKKNLLNWCLLISVDIFLVLSIFLPLLNIVTANPEIGIVSGYHSCFNLLTNGIYLATIPYIIFVLVFIITSIFLYKNKIFKIINLISLLLITVLGLTGLFICFSVATLYGLIYIFSILILTKIWCEDKTKR